jgi:uncharacterized membrane protein YdjX (TVP38/TMEM64 family)
MSRVPDNPIEPDRMTAAPSVASRAATIGAWTSLVLFLALGGWSWANDGLAYDILRSDEAPAWKLARLKTFFDNCGAFAPVVYFLFVTVEVVVAPIPGLMLYAPGGLIFGGFFGGLIALAGNVAGAGIACQVTRSLGGGWLIRFFSREALQKIELALSRRGGWLIFLLRLNPLTSSDLVSYAAGFTPIPVWKVMLATLFGMAPLCFAQAYLAENLFQAFPSLLYPLLILCAVYLVAVVLVVRRLASGESSAEHEPAPEAAPDASMSGSEMTTLENPVDS